MARLMLSVGDMQVSVQPIPGSVSESPAFAKLDDDHPLKAGDHEVMFYENSGKYDDSVVTKVLSECDALEVVGLWLTLETPSERDGSAGGFDTRARLEHLMGEEIEAFLP